MSKQLGITVKKEEDFSEWYQQLLLKSELIDYSSVSGCLVFRPRAYAVWEKIKEKVDKEFKKIGIKNAYFPMFIPEKTLAREEEHVEGFSPEVAWVTEAGDSKLDEKLAVRPTSETIMYESYSKWIRSWKDLPLKINQWNNVVRWEFKHPTPLLRTREFLWNEGHTVYATKKEAEKEKDEIIDIYKDTCDNLLALPSLLGKKSEKEKFAGAEYTVSLEFYMPDGKAIQGPDFHHDGQNFARAFDIKFLDKDEKEKYVYQNTFAITTRMLGIMFAIHSDDKGLVLPPEIAPEQLVIVPIYKDKNKAKVMKEVKKVEKELRKTYTVIVDDDDKTPGWKFNNWELKGVPLRIEIGPKDLENEVVTLVRRDNGEKQRLPVAGITEEVKLIFENMQKDLFEKAKKMLDDNIVQVKDMDAFKREIGHGKIVKARWCGGVNCEDWIKDKSGGAKSLNIPFEQEKVKGKCVQCDKEAKYFAYFGKSY